MDRYPQEADTYTMTADLVLAAILIQALTIISKKVAEEPKAAKERAGWLLSAQRFLDWAIQAHPLIGPIPMTTHVQFKLKGLYYGTLGKEYEEKGFASHAHWAYKQAATVDKARFQPSVDALATRLTAAGMIHIHMDKHPDKGLHDSIKKIEQRADLLNIRSVIHEYLIIDQLPPIEIRPEWFGHEFEGLILKPISATQSRLYMVQDRRTPKLHTRSKKDLEEYCTSTEDDQLP
jgi:hypothetical protein